MSLEAGDGFISGLVVTNPVNATDQVAQGDDHLRLIKTALKGTFPNLTGAVTSSQAELNLLDGVTASTAELNIVDGVTLTAAQINEAARLSVSNVFTGAAQKIAPSAGSVLLWAASVDGTAELRLTNSAVTWSMFMNGASTTLSWYDGSAVQFSIAAGGGFDFKSGAVTTAGLSAAEVGYQGTPQNVQNGNYGIVLTDCGKTIYKSAGGAGETITIPANGTIAIPVGTIIRIVNNGGGDLSIAITTDTLSLAGVGTTGTRTLSDHGVAVIEKVASQEWFISGVGVS